MRVKPRRREIAKFVAACAFLAFAIVFHLTDGFGSLDVQPKEHLDDYQWGELKAIAVKISAAPSDDEGLEIAKRYHLCRDDGTIDPANTKTFTLSNDKKTSATVQVIGFRHDEKKDGTGMAGITLRFLTSVGEVESGSGAAGWDASDMRAAMREIDYYNVSNVVTVKKPCATPVDDGDYDQALAEAGYWCLSATECLGSSEDASVPEEGEQYQLFREQGASWDGDNGILSTSMTYWLRTVTPDASGFCSVDYTGSVSTETLGGAHALVVGFCM